MAIELSAREPTRAFRHLTELLTLNQSGPDAGDEQMRSRALRSRCSPVGKQAGFRSTADQVSGFTVTQTSTGAMNLPGAGLPTSIRSAVTRAPFSKLKLDHGFGIRSNLIVWMGRPVVVFMIVAITAISAP